MSDIMETIRLLDPLLLWCTYLAAMCVGAYLIVLTHRRVKTPPDVVYYNGRRDDSVPESIRRAHGPTEESEDR